MGRNFEESLQKALRMVDGSVHGFEDHGYEDIKVGNAPTDDITIAEFEERLIQPSDTRIHAIAHAFRLGWSVQRIYDLTDIDPWYLHRLENIVETGKRIESAELLNGLKASDMRKAKEQGFSDHQKEIFVMCASKDIHKGCWKRRMFSVLLCVKTWRVCVRTWSLMGLGLPQL